MMMPCGIREGAICDRQPRDILTAFVRQFEPALPPPGWHPTQSHARRIPIRELDSSLFKGAAGMGQTI
jgi:hypothetical protein